MMRQYNLEKKRNKVEIKKGKLEFHVVPFLVCLLAAVIFWLSVIGSRTKRELEAAHEQATVQETTPETDTGTGPASAEVRPDPEPENG